MGMTLLVMTDGRRDCITPTLASLENLRGPITQRVIHDDSGDPDYTAWLKATFPAYRVHATPGRSGFDGAYRSAWSWLREHCRNPWIFSTEDDFVLQRLVNLPRLADVMRRRPALAQMALRRQAWNDAEKAAGGIVEQHPADYQDWRHEDAAWLEHRRFFTTNPHLTRLDFVAAHDWPTGAHSEGRFSVELFAAEPQTRCGFWGPRTDPPLVEHIGHTRVGSGY